MLHSNLYLTGNKAYDFPKHNQSKMVDLLSKALSQLQLTAKCMSSLFHIVFTFTP